MFCSECGNQINDKAVVCPRCGVPVAGKANAAAGTANVPNHMVGAILSTIFCCVIGGVVAIVYATQVNTKLAQGDITGAQAASRAAMGWIIANVCVGLVVSVLSFIAGAAGSM